MDLPPEKSRLVDLKHSTIKKELLHRFLRDQEELLSSKLDTNNNSGIPDIVVLQDDREGESSCYENESDPENSNLDGIADHCLDDEFSHYSSWSSLHRYSVNSNFSPTFDKGSTDFRLLGNSTINRRGSLGVFPSDFQSSQSLRSKYYSQDNLDGINRRGKRLLRTIEAKDQRRLSCDIAELTRSLNDDDHKLARSEIVGLRGSSFKLGNVNKNLLYHTTNTRKTPNMGSLDGIQYSQLNTLPPIPRRDKKD